MGKTFWAAVRVVSIAALSGVAAQSSPRVVVTAREAARRVDITIDGKPFTSYIWPTSQKKPVLYPNSSAKARK